MPTQWETALFGFVLGMYLRQFLDATKNRKTEHKPVEQPPGKQVLFVRLPPKDSTEEFCKCGYPGCLGHQALQSNAFGEASPQDCVFPGITSLEIVGMMMEKGLPLIRFDHEILGVPGNPR